MADSDSFINEVTEEVRRDRLFALLRRWGWVPALAVVGIVGGAAYFEWQRTQQEATAQAFGDALIAGLDRAEPEARLAALDEIDPATPQAAMILALLASGERAAGGDPDAAAAGLRAAAETSGIEPRYRDLALLRAEMLSPSEPSQARIILEALAAPGAPYAALAQEQLALLALREGDTEAALDLFRGIEAGAATTPGLQQRAAQLIVALEAGSTLIESAPAPAPDVATDAPGLGFGTTLDEGAEAEPDDAASETEGAATE
jgi:hypothetical protein